MKLMDRTEKKEIIELLGTLNLYLKAGITQENPSETIDNTLKICDVTCKRHFTKEHYGEYGEVFSTLMGIFANLDWNHTELAEKQQIFTLAGEIIDGLIEKLQEDKRDIKKEIVFLPYNASMWDCMDTVWQAAYEDKDSCNVHVVPIPYCTLTKEMQVDEWHCEENLPDYVPITHWQDMDLEKLHPDVIVIHNPYDGCNAVTSVGRRYWSTELKKCTDRLIYIPYYTASANVSTDIITSPGIVNSDYVVVDNDNIKKQYERCYPEGSYSKDKFVPLGSPKIERALKTTKREVPLPDEWKKIVGDKPVLLYNTSIVASLKSSDYVCDKLRFVFRKYKNEHAIAFWWRPHPLMKDTLKRMRPNIYDEYCAIEQEYIQEGWGIYDDTPNMDRAITWADCYYGEGSGAELSAHIGKLVIRQDISYIGFENCSEISVWSATFCRDGDTIWLVHGALNSLFKYDINSNVISFICQLEGVLFVSANMYAGIECIGNKLYIFPRFADNILCFDYVNNTLSKIELPQWNEYVGMTKFFPIVRIGNSIYCIPGHYPYMVKFDGDLGKITWCLNVQNIIGKICIADASVYDKRYIACLVWHSNKLLWIDTITKNYKIVYIGKRKYNSVEIIGNKIYLGSVDDNVVDCFSAENFSFIYCIQDNFGIVRSYDEQHIMLDNENSAQWCIADSHGSILYLNKDDSKLQLGLKDVFKHAFSKFGSNVVFDTNTCKLYIFDKGIVTVPKWDFEKNINNLNLENQFNIREYPGIDLVKLIKNSDNQLPVKIIDVGKNVYMKLMK